MNGDVRLRVEGLMLERLAARALEEGARFCRVERDGPRAMIFETDPAGARILTSLCERFSLPCQELSRRGRNALVQRLKRRATLLAAAIVCIAVVTAFSSRVWLIDIRLTGDRDASVSALRQALSGMGISPGVPRSRVDPDLIQDALAAASPDFSFVGVRLQGVRLLVEASPAVPAPETYQVDGRRDLIARCDGIILSINVQAGEAAVQPGDTVTRGQVLIRGSEQITKEESRGIAALGTVVARTWIEGTAILPVNREESVLTGRSGVSTSLRLMDFAWPLTEGESYAHQRTEVERLPIGGLFLPLEILRTTARECRIHTVASDPEILRGRLAELAWADARFHLTQTHSDGCEIAGQWIEYTPDGQGNLKARAVYETHTDIAVTRDALYLQGGFYIGNQRANQNRAHSD